MSQKKLGRPVSPNAKRIRFRVRLDDATMAKLDECAEALQTSRSDIIRNGIEEAHERLKKK